MRNSAGPSRFYRAGRLVKFILLPRKKSKAIFGRFFVGKIARSDKEIPESQSKHTTRLHAWWTWISEFFEPQYVSKPIRHCFKNEFSPGEWLELQPGLTLISAWPTRQSTIAQVDAKWVRFTKRGVKDSKTCREFQRYFQRVFRLTGLFRSFLFIDSCQAVRLHLWEWAGEW